MSFYTVHVNLVDEEKKEEREKEKQKVK